MKRIQLQTDYVKLFALVAMTLDHIPKIFGYNCFLNETVFKVLKVPKKDSFILEAWFGRL